MADAQAAAAQIQGEVAHDAPTAGNPLLLGAFAKAAAPADVSLDGDAVNLWALRNGSQVVNLASGSTLVVVGQTTMAASLPVTLASNQSDVPVAQATAANLNARVQGPVGHNNAIGTSNPGMDGGWASVAAPADVSADGNAVRSWHLRNGSKAVTLTAAGALIGGDATNGLDVDVTRVTGTVTVQGGAAQGVATAGNPELVGSQGRSTLPTAVTTGQAANAISDLFGRILTAHIDPAMAIHKNLTYTTTQTGTDVWTPTAGKRIAVTSVILGSYGTTAGRCILWFGDNADVTFTQNTDQVLAAASFAPSANAKPGLVFTPAVPVYCTTADREIHITTDANLSLDVTIEGYEY